MPNFNLIKVDKSYAVQEGDARPNGCSSGRATMMIIASQPVPTKNMATKNPILFRMGLLKYSLQSPQPSPP